MAYLDLDIRIHVPGQPFKPHHTAEWMQMKANDLLHSYFSAEGLPIDIDVRSRGGISDCDLACQSLHPTSCKGCGVPSRVRYNPRCRACGMERS